MALLPRPLLIALMLLASACTTPPPAMEAWRTPPEQAHLPIKATTGRVAYVPEWKREAERAYADATQYIARYARTRAAGSWAVVMDIDQTVLNNVAYQIALDQQGRGYTAGSWRAFVESSEVTLIPGARDFIADVNHLGGHVVFISNRRTYEMEATTETLTAFGILPDRDYRFLLPRDWPEGPESKEERFAAVPAHLAQRGYPGAAVAAYLGDVEGDAPSHTTAAFFCIPQGDLYGKPCKAHRFPR
jgi:5'-nucleotidase (lipoprotein e(P4) family)